jgi:hypothetical protein
MKLSEHTRNVLTATNDNKASAMNKLIGTYYLVEGDRHLEIREARARELIAACYGHGQHKSYPGWDKATLSLGTNQFLLFEEARMAEVAP